MLGLRPASLTSNSCMELCSSSKGDAAALCGVAQASERNLRRALLSFETCRVAQYPLTESQPVQLPDWELYIQVSVAP